MKLANQHTIICGLKGSGKSNALSHFLAEAGGTHLVYDLNHEHEGLTTYEPEHRRGEQAVAELEQVTERLVLGAERDRRPHLFAVEELSRFCGPRQEPPGALYDLVDRNRHYGVGFIGVTRRPSQVHTDMVDLADNVVLFRLTGRADRRRLNDMVDGLGDAVQGLDEHEFVVVNGPEWSRYAPLPERSTTGEL